jgi:hypothetical protein
LLIADDLGVGKQQPIDTPVLTPGGWRAIGTLRSGDEVVGSNGMPTKVLGVFPQGVKPNYRVWFSDSSSTEAGPDHLWTLRYRSGGRRWAEITATTEQLRTGAAVEMRWEVSGNHKQTTKLDLSKGFLKAVPLLSSPVQFAGQTCQLPIPPYTMGQLIANGCLGHGSPNLTTSEGDWDEVREHLAAEGAPVSSERVYSGVVHATLSGCMDAIRALELDVNSGDKRIPACYLRARPEDRIALLHGLMDADGSCSATRNRVSYHTISKRLASGVRELVECLGGTGKISAYDRSHHGKPTEYKVNVRLPSFIPPFRLMRKLARYNPIQRREPRRVLRNIEYSRDVESVCIKVAATDQLYVTEQAILTHNTATAICALTEPRTRPALVVTMTHLQTQWARELTKFTPDMRVHVVEKAEPYDIAVRMRDKTIRHIKKTTSKHIICPSCEGRGCSHCAFAGRVPRESDLAKQTAFTPWLKSNPPFPDVIIMNYHKLAKWAGVLAPKIVSVVYDECQELRRHGNPRTAKSMAADHVSRSVDLRIGLSATPIYNYGGEIWNVIDLLRPGALGSKHEFCREWCIAGSSDDKASLSNPKAFGSYARDAGLMIRRTRKDVGRELPPLTIVPHTVDSDPKALEDVEDVAAELARIILKQGGDWHSKGKAALELDTRMRQATGIGKARSVASFVRMLIESERQVILCGWHHAVYEIWMETLRAFNPVLYTGKQSPTQKDHAREEFLKKRSNVLIMSLRSGAGLDGLQDVCNTIVFGELDWSPGVHEQCLSEDTEVLTRGGFKGVDHVGVGDEVAAFDDGKIVWLPATGKTDRPLADTEQMFAVKTEKIDLLVTGRHRMVVRRKKRSAKGDRSEWEIIRAEELQNASRRCVPVSGQEDVVSGVPLTDHELRLIGWFVSDGSFNGMQLQIYQAKHQRWNADLVETLNQCGVDWGVCTRPNGMNVYYVPSGRGARRWSVDEIDQMKQMVASGSSYGEVAEVIDRGAAAVGKRYRRFVDQEVGGVLRQRMGRGWDHLEPYLDKDLSLLLDGMTRKQLDHFLHGLWMGDGSKSPRLKNVKRITSINKTMLDRLQSICVRRGMSANISERKSRTKVGSKVYDIWIAEAEEASLPGPSKPNRIRAQPWSAQRVWCLTNVVGTLVVRRGGKVAVVGNCIGRVYRDGQSHGSVAYYLVSEDGSDPIVADVLGIKKQQIEGLKDPNMDLVEKLEVDPNHVKKLAQHILESKGIEIEEDEKDSSAA